MDDCIPVHISERPRPPQARRGDGRDLVRGCHGLSGRRLLVLGRRRVETTGQRASQLGDVPRPDLVRRRREQRRLGVLGWRSPRTSLCALAELSEQPIHRANRSEIDAARQEARVDLRRGLVDELLAVQHVEHGLPLSLAEPARARRACRYDGRRLRGCVWRYSVARLRPSARHACAIGTPGSSSSSTRSISALRRSRG